MDVARPFTQQRAVVNSHDVARLHFDDIIEIGYRTVVVSHLHTELSAVVMCKKVVGFEFKRLVIIGKRSAQIIYVITCKCAVDIKSGGGRFKVDCFLELLVGSFPLTL